MTVEASKRFISPYDDAAPAGAEGWQELYPYYLTFREDRREIEEGKFWFADLAHWPRVFKPFDTIMVEYACKCLGQYNTRHYLIPPANGIDYRVHNGYLYMSPVAVPEAEIGARVPQFLERAGHYFANWPTLLENWHVKMQARSSPISRRSTSSRSPRSCPIEWVTEGKGLDNTFDLIRTLQPRDRARLRGVAVPLRVPQPRLRRLPRLLRVLQAGVPGDRRSRDREDGAGRRGRPLPARRRAAQAREARGRARRRRTRSRPATSTTALAAVARRAARRRVARRVGGGQGSVVQLLLGQRLLRDDKVWLDHLEIPLGFLRDYVAPGQGGRGHRPADRGGRRRARADHRPSTARCSPDDETRAAFDEKLGLSRIVFPYVENHNFYVEHWALSVFWRKMPAARRGARRRRASGPTRTTSSTSAATSSSTSSSTTAAAGRSAPTRSGRRTGPPRSSAAQGDRRRALRASRRSRR